MIRVWTDALEPPGHRGIHLWLECKSYPQQRQHLMNWLATTFPGVPVGFRELRGGRWTYPTADQWLTNTMGSILPEPL